MKWYNIKAKTVKNAETKADEIVAQVDLLDEIGFWGITAKDFIDELRAKAGNATRIEMSINSPGGSVYDGVAIFNSLQNLKKPIHVTILGIAASAASYVAMAGTTITMPENTFMMIHNSWGVSMGGADEMREMAELLDKIDASMLATYVKRTGAKEEDVKAWLSKDTYMTAAEAKERGFADEVIPAVAAKAAFDPEQLPTTVKTAFAAAQIKPPEPAVNLGLVSQIEAKATEAGLSEFAASWALDTEIADAADPMKALDARIVSAKETKALCALVKKPDVANAFIAQKVPVADVRKKLLDSAASADEKLDIDAHLKITPAGKTTPEPKPAAKADLGTSIWAAREQQFAK